MLGRARRAVLAVAGTAEGMFGGRSRRSAENPRPRDVQAAPPRPEPKPGLPPRIERESSTGLPPRIEREPTATPPPRIERTPVAGPPRQVVPEPVEPEPVEPERRPEPVRQWEPARPPRTPRRAGMRANVWLTGIICVVLAVGLAGYWVLRVHQRIGQAALQDELGKRETAPTVGCVKLQSNGAVWACAIVYQAESVCLIAKVNALGSWSTAVGHNRCSEQGPLLKLLPHPITAAAVAADVDRQLGSTGTGPGTQCIKEPDHKVRWACQRPPPDGATTGVCEVVRVQPWIPWNFTPSPRLCAHLPGLVKKVHAAGGA
jgi:hypothetical protein